MAVISVEPCTCAARAAPAPRSSTGAGASLVLCCSCARLNDRGWSGRAVLLGPTLATQPSAAGVACSVARSAAPSSSRAIRIGDDGVPASRTQSLFVGTRTCLTIPMATTRGSPAAWSCRAAGRRLLLVSALFAVAVLIGCCRRGDGAGHATGVGPGSAIHQMSGIRRLWLVAYAL